MAACFSPSARRISDCLWPSAFRISAWRTPSASSTSARLLRSAFIWAFIAAVKSAGGWTSFISIRVTFTPQGFVASSTIARSFTLIISRWLSISSSSIEPKTVRILVRVRFLIACSRSLTSYAALAASITWTKQTASIVTLALSFEITSCAGISRTLSIMLILEPTLSTNGIMRLRPGRRVWV